MSSFADPISVSSVAKAGKMSSKLVIAIAPIISEALVQNMEQEQKAEQKAKKAEKSQNTSSFN